MNNGEDNYELRENALWGQAGLDYQKLLAIDIALTFFEKNLDPDYFSIKMEVDGIRALDDVVVSTKESEPICFYTVFALFYNKKFLEEKKNLLNQV